MDIEDRVILLKPEDIQHSFESGPYYKIKPPGGSYENRIGGIDLFPCYTHSRELVIETARECEEKFPIGFPVTYYIVPFEGLSRCNGYAATSIKYDDDLKIGDRHPFGPFVVLWGKRIPIMPSKTRYLTAHEYGHQVDNWICYKKGLSEHDDATAFDKEYAKRRWIECYTGYGGLRWHKNIGEIIANDFRICVAGVENDFWPHECAHPESLPDLNLYWYELMLNYSFHG